MKFIVYADIHHDEYAAKCLTLDDTLEIERKIFERSASIGADFILFCGDRFLKREPKDEVKVLADQVIVEGLAAQKPGFAYFHLVGNHDRVDNTLGWHTAHSLSKQISVQPGIMATPGSYNHPSLPVSVHALPAGYTFDGSKYQVNAEHFNIFTFHDVVCGASSDSQGKHIFKDGISVEDLDSPAWNIVYAGDIHVPQNISFKNTKGGYVGSVLQRTRADACKPRGWLEVEVSKVDGNWKTVTQSYPTRNFFTRYEFEVTGQSTYDSVVDNIDEAWVSDQAVEVKLVGSKVDVDAIADDPKWKNLQDLLLARHLDIIRVYKSEVNEAVVDLTESTSPEDDLSGYLDSGFADLGSLSKDKLFNILEKAHG